jgi:hypothetical protein
MTERIAHLLVTIQPLVPLVNDRVTPTTVGRDSVEP